jgi:hypothetical protein
MTEQGENLQNRSTRTRTMPGDDPLLRAARDEAIRRWDERGGQDNRRA